MDEKLKLIGMVKVLSNGRSSMAMALLFCDLMDVHWEEGMQGQLLQALFRPGGIKTALLSCLFLYVLDASII